MKLDQKDRGKIGIYIIRNIITGKVYVGKSIDIYKRIRNHRIGLNSRNINENRYLINAWHKYGSDAFEYSVLEYLNCKIFDKISDAYLAERELYWMDYYNSCNCKFGYNLRRDSSTGMIVHESTRKYSSLRNLGEKNPNYGHKWTQDQKDRMGDKLRECYKVFSQDAQRVLLWKSRIAKGISNFWKNNPEAKKQMAKKVSENRRKYIFLQYTRDMTFVKQWNSVNEIIAENPTYKWHNIYAVCSGEKKTYMNYIWRKNLRNSPILIER